MSYIAIPIPNVPGRQDVEIDVKINGQKLDLHYRVELLYWADCNVPTFDRVDCLRQMLAGYDQGWTLYYIGSPTDTFVPVTFVRKEDLVKQRTLLTR